MLYTATCDASFHPNRQIISYIIKNNNNVIFKESKFVKCNSSLEAEYIACIELIKKIIELKIPHVVIMTDCKVIFDNLNNEKMNNGKLKDYHKKIDHLLMETSRTRIKWVKREKNKEADHYCRVTRSNGLDTSYSDKNKINEIHKNRIRYVKQLRRIILKCPCCKEHKPFTEFPEESKYRKRVCFNCLKTVVNLQY